MQSGNGQMGMGSRPGRSGGVRRHEFAPPPLPLVKPLPVDSTMENSR